MTNELKKIENEIEKMETTLDIREVNAKLNAIKEARQEVLSANDWPTPKRSFTYRKGL